MIFVHFAMVSWGSYCTPEIIPHLIYNIFLSYFGLACGVKTIAYKLMYIPKDYTKSTCNIEQLWLKRFTSGYAPRDL